MRHRQSRPVLDKLLRRPAPGVGKRAGLVAVGVTVAGGAGLVALTPYASAPSVIPFVQSTPAATPASWSVDSPTGSRDSRPSRSAERTPSPQGGSGDPGTTAGGAPTAAPGPGDSQPEGEPSPSAAADRSSGPGASSPTPSSEPSPSPSRTPSVLPSGPVLPTQTPVPSPSRTAAQSPTPSLPPTPAVPSSTGDGVLDELLGGVTDVTSGLTD